MKQPIRVAITGPAGQIGYALVFRIASGQMFGPDQPVILQLIEVPVEKAMNALKGVAMELGDCAFPLLQDMVLTSDPSVGFKDANWCLLVGAKPRGPGMERADSSDVKISPLEMSHRSVRPQGGNDAHGCSDR